jgi:hypothetical protein
MRGYSEKKEPGKRNPELVYKLCPKLCVTPEPGMYGTDYK